MPLQARGHVPVYRHLPGRPASAPRRRRRRRHVGPLRVHRPLALKLRTITGGPHIVAGRRCDHGRVTGARTAAGSLPLAIRHRRHPGRAAGRGRRPRPVLRGTAERGRRDGRDGFLPAAFVAVVATATLCGRGRHNQPGKPETPGYSSLLARAYCEVGMRGLPPGQPTRCSTAFRTCVGQRRRAARLLAP